MTKLISFLYPHSRDPFSFSITYTLSFYNQCRLVGPWEKYPWACAKLMLKRSSAKDFGTTLYSSANTHRYVETHGFRESFEKNHILVFQKFSFVPPTGVYRLKVPRSCVLPCVLPYSSIHQLAHSSRY